MTELYRITPWGVLVLGLIEEGFIADMDSADALRKHFDKAVCLGIENVVNDHICEGCQKQLESEKIIVRGSR
jgi:hypothetical protein